MCPRVDGLDHALAREAAAVQLRVVGRRVAAKRLEHPLTVEPDELVPAELDRLDPFCALSQRDARNLCEVGLLLHAAGVGQDRACVGQQLEEVDVAEWRSEDQPRRIQPLEAAPPAERPPLYGDGRAGERVVEALLSLVSAP